MEIVDDEIKSGKCEYSEAEQELIKSISPHWYNVIHNTLITPYKLYNILALECFINSRTGNDVECLRSINKHLQDCDIYRTTKEFDDLCKF